MIQKHGDAHIVSFKTERAERSFQIRGLVFVGLTKLPEPDPDTGGNFHVDFCCESIAWPKAVAQWFVKEADARAFHADLCEVMRAQAIRAEIRDGREPDEFMAAQSVNLHMACKRLEKELAAMEAERDHALSKVGALSEDLVSAKLRADDNNQHAREWTQIANKRTDEREAALAMIRRLTKGLERANELPIDHHFHSELIAEARAMGGKAAMDAAVEEDR